jgi:hypothetical protein
MTIWFPLRAMEGYIFRYFSILLAEPFCETMFINLLKYNTTPRFVKR